MSIGGGLNPSAHPDHIVDGRDSESQLGPARTAQSGMHAVQSHRLMQGKHRTKYRTEEYRTEYGLGTWTPPLWACTRTRASASD